ncbi:hypothetical protein FNV43_RR21743 [Rhamnella rubrinervis]|uniref:Retrotransposon gag domain-containing protein n=1 Tax=Rhamnella rubrinervis TaxID=2594499 RepID=A0A8K0DUU9_9ROSA|nr:hypothetical protein FNV43_RR21743 [Rhamnella rubrinervis]
MVETRSTAAGKKSTGPTVVGSTSDVNEKNPTGYAAVGDVNENKEIDEPVMAAEESLINDLRYQIGGLGDQVVRIGEKISRVGQSIKCSMENLANIVTQQTQQQTQQTATLMAYLQQAIPTAIHGYQQNQLINLEAVDRLIEEQVGPTYRRISRPVYRRPYPEAIERMELPRNVRYSDFTLFSGEENQSTIEHIDRFTIQCGEAAANDFLKLKLFANSFTSSTFTWFINLPANSIHTWQEMERKFHEQFYKIEPEVSMADLSHLYQRENETIESFLACFKRVKNQCHLDVPEREFVKLAISGLSYRHKKKFVGMEFGDLLELARRATRYEDILNEEYQRKNSSNRTYYKDPNLDIHLVDSEDQTEDSVVEVGLAEVVATRPYTCRALVKPLGTQKTFQLAKETKSRMDGPERIFSFDITKADQIFDLLLADKVIKLPNGHRIPSIEEIKKRQYCKWYHSWSHDTVNCLQFRNALQALIEKGTLKLPEKGSEVKDVDNNPFPVTGVNMTTANISKLAPRKDLSVSMDRSNKRSERSKNEKEEVFHKEKQLCTCCKHEIEAETRPEKNIKDKGKATLKSPPKTSQQLLQERYEDGDRKVGLLGAPSGKFEYYVQYSKPDSHHQCPIKPTGWDLNKPRKHDRSVVRRTERHDWTAKTFRPPVIEVGRWYQARPRYYRPLTRTQKMRLQREHAATRRKVEEREKGITAVKQVEDGTVGPLAMTSRAKDDVTDVKQVEDGTYDSMVETSKAMDDDSLAKA